MYDLKKSIKNIIEYKQLPPRNNKNTTINIGYGINDNYSRCAGTSIVSFCLNNPEQKFSFYILASDLSDISKENFKILAKQYSINIIIYEIDASFFAKLPTRTAFPIPTYFRFIFPLILKDLNKIFYIDADIICLNNAEKLFNVDFEDNIIAAVPDTKETSEDRNKDLELFNHIYFNAGVLAVNVQKWNNFNIFNKLIDNLLEKPEKFYMLDQDALNLILTNKVKYLPRKFNWFNGFYKWNVNSIDSKEIILLHFTSSPKPWDLGWKLHSMCNEYNTDLYDKYEQLTPWANTPPVKPKTYKKMRLYAKDLKRNGDYIEGMKWHFKYLTNKIKYLVKK